MSKKEVPVQEIVNTIKILKDTCNLVYQENENLTSENENLRVANEKLRNGSSASVIDNEDLFTAMQELQTDIKRWRKTSIDNKVKKEKRLSSK